MLDSLANKYRPTEFQDLIGQKLTAVVLQRMVDTGSVPSGLLFSGPSGTGKTSAARVLAAKLNPGQSFETFEIDAASNGVVADVRRLIETLRYSTGSSFRTVIVDEAHSMSREAFNALLKTLEEPPAGTVFVLVTTEPEKVPETVLTRLMEFEFRRVSIHDIFVRLQLVSQKEKIDVTPELLHRLAQGGEGSVRKALMALDQVARAGIRTVEQYYALVGEQDTAPDLISALMTGNSARIFEVLEHQLEVTANPNTISAQVLSCLRDLLVLRCGGTLTIAGPQYEARKELASILEQERILAACRILWDLKTRVRGSDNPRSSLELSLILIAEVFSRGKTPPPPPPAPPAPKTRTETLEVPTVAPAPRKLTLAELRQRV